MFLAILLTAQATSVGAGPVPTEVPACCRHANGRAGLVVAAAPPDEAPARTEVDRVLDLVERQSAGLKSYRGRVSMENYDDLADESERRFGRVWLVAPATGDASTRQAAVVFDRIVESGGRVRERLEHWVYRDGVLSDYDPEAKRLVRRPRRRRVGVGLARATVRARARARVRLLAIEGERERRDCLRHSGVVALLGIGLKAREQLRRELGREHMAIWAERWR